MMRFFARRQGVWLTLVAWLLVATVAQAGNVSVRAFLDRTHVALGATVTLNIEADGTARATQPDVSALDADFVVRGTSQSTQMNYVNGHGSVKTLWAIALQPRHAGTLVIPALTVDGQQTQALTLTVGAAPATPRGAPGDPVFVRVKPSTTAPYVGQQIDLDVRLYYVSGVTSGAFSLPQGKAIEVRETGKDSHYQAQRGGQLYHVLEKHYALIVQRAGAITLAPVTFQGTLATQGGFFSAGRAVQARSAPIALAVRAQPQAAGKGAWLPARNVTLKLTGLPADGRVKAGQSVTLTLTETATGLPFESLPEPQLPKLAGVDVYPDQTSSHTDTAGHWLQGTRTRKFALVAQRAGTLRLPAITLPWWNVTTDKREVAQVPARTLTVTPTTLTRAQPAPSASAVVVAPAMKAALAPPTAPAAATGVAKLAPVTGAGYWLAWLAIALWLVSVVIVLAIWWWRRRRVTRPRDPSPKPADAKRATARQRQQAFVASVRTGDATAQGEALLAWARATRPELPHLGELAAALAAPAQRQAIDALQRARYAADGSSVDAEWLSQAFAAGFDWRETRAVASQDEALPPLYPPA